MLGLTIGDISRLAVVFPADMGEDPPIALPLVLPMGWKNSGPEFCAARVTIADVCNATIASYIPHAYHHLDARAAAIDFNSIPQSSTSHTYQLDPDHPSRSPLLKRMTRIG